MNLGYIPRHKLVRRRVCDVLAPIISAPKPIQYPLPQGKVTELYQHLHTGNRPLNVGYV